MFFMVGFLVSLVLKRDLLILMRILSIVIISICYKIMISMIVMFLLEWVICCWDLLEKCVVRVNRIGRSVVVCIVVWLNFLIRFCSLSLRMCM